MTADERVELWQRARRQRAGWLRLEEAAAEHGDEELDSRVAIVRLAMLDVIDRLEQLTIDVDLDCDFDEAVA